MGCVVIYHFFVRYAMRGQCLAEGRPLQRPAQQVQGQVIPAIPEVHRRIVLCDQVGKAVFIVEPAAHKGVDAHTVDRCDLGKLHDGIRQDHCAGLGQAIVFIAQSVRCKQARQMSAGRIADQGVAFRLHAELLCVAGDVLHRPCNVLHGAVVVVIRVGAVAHHEHRIAFLVQLVSCGDALL